MKAQEHDGQTFVSPGTAAKASGVCLQTLRRWAKLDLIPYYRTPGGHYRYCIEAVLRRAPAPAPQVVVPIAPTIPAPIAVRAPAPTATVAPAPAVQHQPPPTRYSPAELRHMIEVLASNSAVA